MKKFLRIFINLLIFGVVFLGCKEEFKAEIGSIAPEISATNLNGEKVKIQNDKISIIVFWQYGCLGCTQILPNLDEFLKENPGIFRVYAINSLNDEKIIKDYLNEMSFSSILVLKDDLKISLDRYGVTTLPSIFIVDKNGILKDKIYGDIGWKYLKAKLSYFL
ncbi:TlpA family protein disulfide reductase [Campylobacter corcagiensis]|uniref:TlpA family protein disulfide reductase n=1 Tax=Campylobacter corcagiensis TaxID=1448857 RepID=A0A7M1LFP7_9BACT|nr:TlpA disulfide reductase family protein [Campylobacter corcagiensis]QKF64702.1 protein disulfide reductase, TlpA family [Campylobacter corcagiensis]QOQ87133.1 TlpA family protein disulfide reductase [Campylobacter corcagiensis]